MYRLPSYVGGWSGAAQAVAGFLAENRAGLEDSFGIWKKRGVDGVEYQEKLRREWGR